mmetsp:Transcript_14959/g.22505  ORF Transcript_14959/g.22505 Transcript_14959/m.22505 type:complete len:91 (+) Transcript_14959:46-318(+)|eukprot:scaffold42760_cov216-Skeletonema_dohrnii-CCMP3373.AAC.1
MLHHTTIQRRRGVLKRSKIWGLPRAPHRSTLFNSGDDNIFSTSVVKCNMQHGSSSTNQRDGNPEEPSLALMLICGDRVEYLRSISNRRKK